MPARWFICPDKERVEMSDCINQGGCRMGANVVCFPVINNNPSLHCSETMFSLLVSAQAWPSP